MMNFNFPCTSEKISDRSEIWLKHYSSSHSILLVGEGDFSFSLCLARFFRSACNIVATSLDDKATVTRNYGAATSNLNKLERMGCTILHGLDATNMKFRMDLNMRKFDRIVFNFPHAGFHGKEDDENLINMHRQLLHGFFYNARSLLHPYGQVHVSHKTGLPFCNWKLEELAADNSLILLECVDFKLRDYPGYNNKRGDGNRCDEPFPLGQCSTFKFIIRNIHREAIPNQMGCVEISRAFSGCNNILSDGYHPQMDQTTYFSGSLPTIQDYKIYLVDQCLLRIFDGYFRENGYIFQGDGYGDASVLQELLWIGCEIYLKASPGRSRYGYFKFLCEFLPRNALESPWFQAISLAYIG